MKKYTKIICMIAAVCLLGAAAFCGFRIYSHYAHESKQEEVFEKIAKVVEQAQTGESETADVLLTEEETVLMEYGELYLQNTDMVGWLSIAGTNINYPVMQTPNNPNYYLKHNFEKEYSDLGTPYVQENCDLLTSDSSYTLKTREVLRLLHREFVYVGDPVPELNEQEHAAFLMNIQKSILLSLEKRKLLTHSQRERCLVELEKQYSREQKSRRRA